MFFDNHQWQVAKYKYILYIPTHCKFYCLLQSTIYSWLFCWHEFCSRDQRFVPVHVLSCSLYNMYCRYDQHAEDWLRSQLLWVDFHVRGRYSCSCHVRTFNSILFLKVLTLDPSFVSAHSPLSFMNFNICHWIWMLHQRSSTLPCHVLVVNVILCVCVERRRRVAWCACTMGAGRGTFSTRWTSFTAVPSPPSQWVHLHTLTYIQSSLASPPFPLNLVIFCFWKLIWCCTCTGRWNLWTCASSAIYEFNLIHKSS